MVKSKSKSKAKATKKKCITKKNTTKAKKQTVTKKSTIEKKSRITKSIATKDSKNKIKAKEKKYHNKDRSRKKGKKVPPKEIKNKINEVETIGNAKGPEENIEEVQVESEKESNELPIVMDGTENDKELQDDSDKTKIEIDENNRALSKNDEIEIDLNLNDELISEQIKLNLNCLVNLPQIPLSDIETLEQDIADCDRVEESAKIDNRKELCPELTDFINNLSRVDLGVNETVEDRKQGQDSSLKSLQNQEVINCTCGFPEEDGLMVQCDVCLMWQHALCCGMSTHSQVPENYLCIYCMQPKNIRPSQSYSYARHFLTLSKLPSFTKRTMQQELLKRREDILTKTFRLTADLRKIGKIERTVTAKLSVAEEPDHPKLYMWSGNWDQPDHTSPFRRNTSHLVQDGPVGERPIESVDCRLRLLEKIESDQKEMAARLSLIYDQITQLELLDDNRKEEEKNIKKILKLLENDLNTIATAVSIS